MSWWCLLPWSTIRCLVRVRCCGVDEDLFEIQITCLLAEVCVLCSVLVDGTFILRLGVNLFHFEF